MNADPRAGMILMNLNYFEYLPKSKKVCVTSHSCFRSSLRNTLKQDLTVLRLTKELLFNDEKSKKNICKDQEVKETEPNSSFQSRSFIAI